MGAQRRLVHTSRYSLTSSSCLPHCCKSLNRSAIPLKNSGISAQLQQDKGEAVVPAPGPQALDNAGAGRFRLSLG